MQAANSPSIEHITTQAVQNIQQQAKAQLSRIKDFYSSDPSLMLEQYEFEKKTTEEYNGRQLLELIQNADDAASATKNASALIYLSENRLIIANNGQHFTREGLDSILHGHISPKINKKNQIGNKGLGFRSILNWTDSITIKSGDLHIRFSKRYSRDVLEELIAGNPKVGNSIVKRYGKEEAAIAVLRCPEIMDEVRVPEICKDFDTVIILELKDGIAQEVNKQLSDTIDAEMMLFLNHLNRIEINTPLLKHTLERTLMTIDQVKEQRIYKKIQVAATTFEGTVYNEWNVYGLTGTIHSEDSEDIREYELAVAWQDELKEGKNLLHSFFRTNVTFKFPGILYGTFELSSNRNELIQGEGHNTFLFGEAARLIAETAEYIAMHATKPVGYNALHLAMVDFASLSVQIKASDFEAKLKGAIKTRKIFPAISNEYIDWSVLPAYYEEEEFAKYLTPNVFTRLLHCCDTTEEEVFVTLLQPGVYNINCIISDIASKRHLIPLDDYSKLVLQIHSLIEAGAGIPGLLFDEKGALLDFGLPIFFPHQNNYGLSSDIGVQIISRKLTGALLTAAEVSSFALLSDWLSKFRLRVFSFDEVAELIISHFGSGKASLASVINMNKQLFSLFNNEPTITGNWKGSSILLASKRNKIIPADKLYFGKEYNNPVAEDLFSYDKNKLVAGPEKYKLTNTEDWIKYLSWAGVSMLPRRIKTKGEREYAVYCMKKFDFRNKIEDYYFSTGFKGFKTQLTGGYGTVDCTTVEDLDAILQNNSPEAVLAWLNADDAILKLLETDSEPASSRLGFWFYSARNERLVYGHLLKNYIRWKLSNSKWLNTESGPIQNPDNCTTAATITSDFSPLIEKPLVNYDLLKKKGINKDKADYLITLVGVHKSINSFSTATLYSILSKLREIDPEGKKVRNIYNQLAVNFEDRLLDRIDKDDPNYVEFTTNGEVFCKSQSWVPVQEAWYVNDKRLGESVIRQFEVIEIDRRRGKEKIRKLFNVKPLEKIRLRLSTEPAQNPISPVFEQDLESFKPYVYVLRQEADSGSEKNLIKEIRFKLVSDIDVVMAKNETEEHIKLEDFEYFYLRERNIIYIKTPLYLDSIDKLKQDVSFCSSIAEAFSAMLDVDAQRQQIRELFSKSLGGRNDILRSEMDDINLERLARAREKLGITNSPKIEFWRSFVKCFRNKRLSLDNYQDQLLLAELIKLFPRHELILSTVYNEINYENTNEEYSSALVVKLFAECAVPIKLFNTFHYPLIDISELYQLTYKRSKERYKDIFTQLCFRRCESGALPKNTFTRFLAEYENLTSPVVNEVDFNAVADLENAVREKFNIDLSDKSDHFDIDRIYFYNRERLVQAGSLINISRSLIEQFLSENVAMESLLYFNDEIDTIIQQLKSWTGQGSRPGPGAVGLSGKRLSFGKDVVVYDDLADLKAKVDALLNNAAGITQNTVRISKTNLKASNKPGNKGGKAGGKRLVLKEDIGFLGEYIVYTHLLNTIKNKESVRWVSQYAKDCGVNSAGKDGLGYDIEYIPNGATHPRYVEVKVVGWENAFHISAPEVKYGEQYKDNYEIFLLRNIENPTEAKIQRVVGIFNYKGKSFTDNDLFTVVNDSFILKFNVT
jgi:hypothetical protein